MVSAVTNLSMVHVACVIVVNIAMCRSGGMQSFIMQTVEGISMFDSCCYT